MPLNQKELQIDVCGEGARALHRVVRAMHDGHCPDCGYLAPSEEFVRGYDPSAGGDPPADSMYHQCPKCLFTVTWEEANAALRAFQPHFHKSVTVFERWRRGESLDAADVAPVTPARAPAYGVHPAVDLAVDAVTTAPPVVEGYVKKGGQNPPEPQTSRPPGPAGSGRGVVTQLNSLATPDWFWSLADNAVDCQDHIRIVVNGCFVLFHKPCSVRGSGISVDAGGVIKNPTRWQVVRLLNALRGAP